MLKLLVILVAAATLLKKDSTDFSVTIELIRSATSEKIEIAVTVKNLTGSQVRIFKSRRDDYKRERIRALGNYVIELQRWDSVSYQLFPPSADINPTYQKEEFISLQDTDAIRDTLSVFGYEFSRNTKGFPPGKYRIRVFFNPDMWATTERYFSNWIEFNID